MPDLQAVAFFGIIRVAASLCRYAAYQQHKNVGCLSGAEFRLRECVRLLDGLSHYPGTVDDFSPGQEHELTFQLRGEELRKAKEFTQKHRHSSRTVHSYRFIPTGIGTAVKIGCACGAEVDATDVSEW